MWYQWTGALLGALAFAAPAEADIASARYLDPTPRYGHGVLGAEGEYETLEITLDNGRTSRLTWPDTVVFEDTVPRLFDLDGDGTKEVIAVQSHQSAGAQVAIYRVNGSRLEPAGTNAFIGTRFRWLAIIGIADLDQDGNLDIAYVDRPHLAKTLRVLTVTGGDGKDFELSLKASKKGVSNHRIGEDFITGGIRDCGSGPEMVTADAGWRQTIVSTFDGQSINLRANGPFSQQAIKEALACR